jgi:ribosomal protein S18 acetylase RimI-like enzyme
VTTEAPAIDQITAFPLTPDRLSDLATLFEQGGDPKWCWCTSFRVAAWGPAQRQPVANRAMLTALAEQGPPAPGLIAYRDGRAIGWVSVGPREGYARLAATRVLAPVDDRPTWSIVCFVVGRHDRGQGVAAALLDAAIRHARASGARLLEAYPADTDGGRIPSAAVYNGALSMFERAGFVVVARRRANATTPEHPIVRLELETAHG